MNIGENASPPRSRRREEADAPTFDAPPRQLGGYGDWVERDTRGRAARAPPHETTRYSAGFLDFAED